MTKPLSAPTARVLDVLELLSQPGSDRLRFTDVARELDLTQGTANAILNTLTDRGWIDRDAADKRYSIGAGLALLATRVQATRTLAHAAGSAARQLAAETGILVSLTEHVGDELVILAFEGGEPGPLRGVAGDRIPYIPPFGLTFVAWAPAAEQAAWMARATSTPAVLEDLHGLLAATRERGYSVDWMTEAMDGVAQLMSAFTSARSGTLSSLMRRIMDELLVEYIGPQGSHTEHAPTPDAPVIVISAPIYARPGQVALNLSLHPLRAMPDAEVEALGNLLTRTCAEVTASVSAG